MCMLETVGFSKDSRWLTNVQMTVMKTELEYATT